jgi:hypothetical protein
MFRASLAAALWPRMEVLSIFMALKPVLPKAAETARFSARLLWLPEQAAGKVILRRKRGLIIRDIARR